MQPYLYQNQNNQFQMAGPASSKALTKLKNDRFIPTQQINYNTIPSQQLTNYQPSQNIKTHISFNNNSNSNSNINPNTYSNPNTNTNTNLNLNQSGYGNQLKINIQGMQRQNSNESKLSTSRSNLFSQSQLTLSNSTFNQSYQTNQPQIQTSRSFNNNNTNFNINPNSNPNLNINLNNSTNTNMNNINNNVNFNNSNNLTNRNSLNLNNSTVTNNWNRYEQTLKPQSVFPRSNNISTNVDISRIRSNSASQFSLNNNNINTNTNTNINSMSNNINNIESDRRIASLQLKLSDYQKQILQANNKLNEKQKKLTQLQHQLLTLRTKSNQIQLKLHQNQQNYNYSTNKQKQLQSQNKQLSQKKQQIQKQLQQKIQKIQLLQNSADKILKSKNIQIQTLNQSCKQLSKNIQILQDKYEQKQNKIQNLQNKLNQNQQYFKNIHQKIKNTQQIITNNTYQNQNYIKKISQQYQQIIILQTQNKTLKTQLSNYIEQVQKLQKLNKKLQAINIQYNKVNEQLQKTKDNFENTKKIGQQQIQFLQAKLQESGVQRQRLLEELELTKVVAIKKNMVFQRQVIYQLKKQNDRLWNKLIQKQEDNVQHNVSSPQYWSRDKVVTTKSILNPNLQHIQKPQSVNNNYNNNINNNYNNYKPNSKGEPIKPTQYQPQLYQQQIPNNNLPFYDLQKNFQTFISQIQKKQNSTPLSNSTKLTNQYYNFYKNKCVDLQKIVQQHLTINYNLKSQLQKIQNNTNNNNILNVQITFLKNQLDQQRVLNQTLKRSFELFKNQYQLKFKSAQNKVQQIQIQTSNKLISTSGLSYTYPSINQSRTHSLKIQSIQILNSQLTILQHQNRKLTLQNSQLNIKISELNRYQSLYWQLKQKYDQMSPISQFRQYKQTGKIDNSRGDININIKSERQQKLQIQRDNLLRQLQILKKIWKDQQQSKKYKIQINYRNKCETLQKQLKLKDNQFELLYKDLQKLQSQFYTSRIHHNNLLTDIANLQQQLSTYKQGRKSIDKHQISLTISLLKQRLLEIQIHIRELNKLYILSKQSYSKLNQDKNIWEIGNLIINLQNAIGNSLQYCQQIQQSRTVKL